jgi:hypothetical protein
MEVNCHGKNFYNIGHGIKLKIQHYFTPEKVRTAVICCGIFVALAPGITR